jgi:ABC-2 type transport system ATP-binding protein
LTEPPRCATLFLRGSWGFFPFILLQGGNMATILSFDKVTKQFENVKALDSLSFQIPENKIVGLIGANGAGKTTALRHMIRYLVPDAGTITYRDTDVYSLPATSFPITYIPETPVYYEELTVREHVSFISAMYQTENIVQPLISAMEMEEHLNKVPSILSKGTKQKLMILCAFLRRYELLIADEPFTGLDPKQSKGLKDLFLQQKAEGKTILLSTHLLDMVESLCDYYIMLDHGKLLAQGSLHDIAHSDHWATLEELYLYLSETNNRNDLTTDD